jgi:tyrosine-protein phosphatase SIW14
MSNEMPSSRARRHALRSTYLLVSAALVVGCAAAPGESDSDGVVSASASAVKRTSPIQNFAEVATGVYRGANPGDDGLEYLAGIGVRADLDLQTSPFAVAEEEEAAADLGLTFTSEPISPLWKVNDDQMDRILGILADPARRPIYVHCRHGQDRTGMVIGVFRVLHEGWAPEDAYAEMLDHGFHPGFVMLKEYFEDKTGWEE